jgi:hypothetical protein
MATCEDYPCCGHEPGRCPRFVNGVQIDMVCTCGARLPVGSRFSICADCLRRGEDGEVFDGGDEPEEGEEEEPCEECDGEGCDICGGYDEGQPSDLTENEDFAHDDDLYPEFDDPMTYGED